MIEDDLQKLFGMNTQGLGGTLPGNFSMSNPEFNHVSEAPLRERHENRPVPGSSMGLRHHGSLQMDETENTELRVLAVGPLPPPYGGTTVSFQWLVRELAAVDYVKLAMVLDTGADKSVSTLTKVARALRLVARAARSMHSVDVVLFNASARRAMVFGAVFVLLTRLFNKPLVVRVFGGGLDDDYCRAGPVFRWCADSVFETSTVLLQTHRLVDAFSARHPRSTIVWFPTSRNHQCESGKEGDSKRLHGVVRFVYATDVRPEKGIDTLLEVFRGLDGGSVELDVFGELAEPYRDDSADAVAGWPKGVRYRGAVDSDSLRAALGAYDCLLLPTRCNSEGYPGIIIEAFGAGVPVVASRIGAIPEIVDDSCGILLDPLDIDAWGDAISWISSSATIRRGLKQGALVRGASFDSRIWNGQVLVKVLALAAGKGTQE